ncbi:MAG: copper amine oxidase N-terminal domain-containing protein [bacterium]|nr:copper amine oxidase N-terminal domain-containing protein [bacterium]
MKLSLKTAMASTAMAVMFIPALAAPKAETEFIGVIVNGHALFPPQQPVMTSGRTLVPMRSIFEAMGTEVKYDAPTKVITAKTTDGQTSIVLALNSPDATVNGKAVKLEVPASSMHGSTMVPLRFIGEALGAKVAWNGVERIIRVASPGFENTLTDSEAFKESHWDYAKNLGRIQVGSQAGLRKVMDSTNTEPLFSRAPSDDFSEAAIAGSEREAVYSVFGLDKHELRSLARKMIANYSTNRKNRLQFVHMLGLIGSEKEDIIDQATSSHIQAFLVDKLNNGDSKLSKVDNNAFRRHVIMALAVMDSVTPETVEAVIKTFETCDNNYVLSPIPNFFKMHSAQIKAMPKIGEYRARISAVQNLNANEAVRALQ